MVLKTSARGLETRSLVNHEDMGILLAPKVYQVHIMPMKATRGAITDAIRVALRMVLLLVPVMAPIL